MASPFERGVAVFLTETVTYWMLCIAIWLWWPGLVRWVFEGIEISENMGLVEGAALAVGIVGAGLSVGWCLWRKPTEEKFWSGVKGDWVLTGVFIVLIAWKALGGGA